MVRKFWILFSLLLWVPIVSFSLDKPSLEEKILVPPPAPISQDLFHLGNVDFKTARVFIAFATDRPTNLLKENVNSPSIGFPVDAPYTDPSEMGALLYGGTPLQNNPLMQVMMHPDMATSRSMLLQTAHPNSISLLDMKSQRVVGAISISSRPFWLAFSPDGKRFWVIDEKHDLTMFSNLGEKIASVNVGDTNLVSDLAVNPIGDRVYLAVRSWPSPLILIADGISNALIGNFQLPSNRGEPGGIAVSPDGKTLLVTLGMSGNGWLEVLDVRSGQIIKEIKMDSEPLGVAVTPDGKKAVVANYGSGFVDIVDFQQGNILAHIKTGLEPVRVAMRSDGSAAFVTNEGNNTLSVIDLKSLSLQATVNVGKGPMGVAVTPDGKEIYVANHDSGDITIVNGVTFAILGTTPTVSELHPYGIAIAP